MTIRERVRIKAGGLIEIAHPSLLPGEEAEVTVRVSETPASQAGEGSPAGGSSRPLWQRIVEIGASVPEEEWAKVPEDLSKNLDHYLYGAPQGEDE
jgi:hypothetical protein